MQPGFDVNNPQSKAPQIVKPSATVLLKKSTGEIKSRHFLGRLLIKSRTASRRSLERVLKSKPRAKNQGIGMEFILDDLAGLPMSDEDIVIILTNLIDNAMNAAKKADLKMIQVFMSYDKKEFLCAVKNSVAEKVPIENNEVMLKPADIYHGFGLKNVRSVLSKYDSIYSLESTDDRFIFTMLIYF